MLCFVLLFLQLRENLYDGATFKYHVGLLDLFVVAQLRLLFFTFLIIIFSSLIVKTPFTDNVLVEEFRKLSFEKVLVSCNFTEKSLRIL